MKDKKRPNQDVFINCPFDPEFLDMFRAIVFAVRACGLQPCCSKDENDSGKVRIEKILRLIKDCDWGIHDLSAVGLDPVAKVPRFNMPLELGISIGAQRFGGPRQRLKKLLILEQNAHRYDASTSDISGQDIEAHRNNPDNVIRAVRDWIADNLPAGSPPPPGGQALAKDYVIVRRHIEYRIGRERLDPWTEMTHRDFLISLEAGLAVLKDSQ